jgi:hypothetical protein
MKTPLVLVSCSMKAPLLKLTRAWRLETCLSGNTQSLSGRRPMVPPAASNSLREEYPMRLAQGSVTSSLRIMWEE